MAQPARTRSGKTVRWDKNLGGSVQETNRGNDPSYSSANKTVHVPANIDVGEPSNQQKRRPKKTEVTNDKVAEKTIAQRASQDGDRRKEPPPKTLLHNNNNADTAVSDSWGRLDDDDDEYWLALRRRQSETHLQNVDRILFGNAATQHQAGSKLMKLFSNPGQRSSPTVFQRDLFLFSPTAGSTQTEEDDTLLQSGSESELAFDQASLSSVNTNSGKVRRGPPLQGQAHHQQRPSQDPAQQTSSERKGSQSKKPSGLLSNRSSEANLFKPTETFPKVLYPSKPPSAADSTFTKDKNNGNLETGSNRRVSTVDRQIQTATPPVDRGVQTSTPTPLNATPPNHSVGVSSASASVPAFKERSSALTTVPSGVQATEPGTERPGLTAAASGQQKPSNTGIDPSYSAIDPTGHNRVVTATVTQTASAASVSNGKLFNGHSPKPPVGFSSSSQLHEPPPPPHHHHPRPPVSSEQPSAKTATRNKGGEEVGISAPVTATTPGHPPTPVSHKLLTSPHSSAKKRGEPASTTTTTATAGDNSVSRRQDNNAGIPSKDTASADATSAPLLAGDSDTAPHEGGVTGGSAHVTTAPQGSTAVKRLKGGNELNIGESIRQQESRDKTNPFGRHRPEKKPDTLVGSGDGIHSKAGSVVSGTEHRSGVTATNSSNKPPHADVLSVYGDAVNQTRFPNSSNAGSKARDQDTEANMRAELEPRKQRQRAGMERGTPHNKFLREATPMSQHDQEYLSETGNTVRDRRQPSSRNAEVRNRATVRSPAQDHHEQPDGDILRESLQELSAKIQLQRMEEEQARKRSATSKHSRTSEPASLPVRRDRSRIPGPIVDAGPNRAKSDKENISGSRTERANRARQEHLERNGESINRDSSKESVKPNRQSDQTFSSDSDWGRSAGYSDRNGEGGTQFDDSTDWIADVDIEEEYQAGDTYVFYLQTEDGSIVGPMRFDVEGIDLGLPVAASPPHSKTDNDGLRNRQTGSHGLNEFSSRSHSVLTVTIDSETQPDTEDENLYVTKRGKLSFVDLAGSEKVKDASGGFGGPGMLESNSINKSLLVLGNCISHLGDSKRRHGHIPYRDSKLTKLLSDSLGGNGITLMIACITPSSSNTTETMNTLRYASRAKKIKSKPTVKMDPREKLILNLKREIKVLRNENHYLRQQLDFPAKPKGQLQKENDEKFMKFMKEQKEKESGLYEMLQEYMVENENLRAENSEMHSNRDRIRREQQLLYRENEKLMKRVEEMERVMSQNPTMWAASKQVHRTDGYGQYDLTSPRTSPVGPGFHSGHKQGSPPGSRGKGNPPGPMKPPHRLPDPVMRPAQRPAELVENGGGYAANNGYTSPRTGPRQTSPARQKERRASQVSNAEAIHTMNEQLKRDVMQLEGQIRHHQYVQERSGDFSRSNGHSVR